MKLIQSLILSAVSVTSIALITGCTWYVPPKGVGASASFKGPVGLQLYSLRADFPKDVPGTLQRVKGYGFKYVELAGTYDKTPEQFKAMLDAIGLVPIAAHFPYDRYKTDAEGIAREAKALGLKYVGVAWIPHQGDFDEKECREAIDVFNNAGRAMADHGLKFFYHNHGYEFQPHGTGTLFDLMMAETNPKHVSYEMDLFWTHLPGQDPAALLEKYGSRWALVHLKDIKKGVPTGSLTGQSDVRNDVVLGTGQIDLPATLKAAQKAGVKYYFIEDESPTAGEQIPQSLRYLESVDW
jgi:sugar phosphate isomerase/epimerase